MPPEDPRAAEAREWLEKALLDLRAAEVGLAAEPPLAADVVFHCQQLVEKSMKCFLARSAWPSWTICRTRYATDPRNAGCRRRVALANTRSC